MFGFQLTAILITVLIANLTGTVFYIQNATTTKTAVLAAKVEVSPVPSISPSPIITPGPSVTPSIKPFIKPSIKPSPTPTVKPSILPSVTPNPTTSPTPSASSNAQGSNTQSNSPKLSSVDPSDAAFSTPMTLRGEGFGGQTGIINVFNSKGEPQPYPPSYSWSDSEIKTHSPFFAPDSEYQLEIQTADGKKSNRLTVKSGAGQPHVDEISPSGAKPGDEITLKGGRFENNSGSVNFFLNYPDISGSGSVVSWSENEIKIKLPSNLEAGKEYGIQVINGRGGQSSFKYYTLGS